MKSISTTRLLNLKSFSLQRGAHTHRCTFTCSSGVGGEMLDHRSVVDLGWWAFDEWKECGAVSSDWLVGWEGKKLSCPFI